MSRRARWVTTTIGALLVAEGIGKALDPAGYQRALAAFDLISPSLAWPWMAAELLAGAALVYSGLRARPRRQPALAAMRVALALQIAYAALSTSAYIRHLPIRNCTCFGVYLKQPVSWFVLLEDAYLIALCAWQAKKLRRNDLL